MRKIEIHQEYRPSEYEPYMCPQQLEYFKRKLVLWKEGLLQESRETLKHMQEEKWQESDLNDRATVEIDASFELRTRNRYRKLIEKIDSALERIETAEYGYCEVTGDQIGLKRLEVRPIATLSIEAQEQHESYEKQHNNDE